MPFWKSIVSRISRINVLRPFAQQLRRWRKPYRLYVDKHSNGEITSAICTVEGWFAYAGAGAALSLRINGVDLKWVRLDLPTVKLLFGDKHCDGFRAIIDLRQF